MIFQRIKIVIRFSQMWTGKKKHKTDVGLSEACGFIYYGMEWQRGEWHKGGVRAWTAGSCGLFSPGTRAFARIEHHLILYASASWWPDRSTKATLEAHAAVDGCRDWWMDGAREGFPFTPPYRCGAASLLFHERDAHSETWLDHYY